MKKKRQYWLIALVVILAAAILGGYYFYMNRFDAGAYVKAVLDVSYKDQIQDYMESVSYTHLDVYKRQGSYSAGERIFRIIARDIKSIFLFTGNLRED